MRHIRKGDTSHWLRRWHLDGPLVVASHGVDEEAERRLILRVGTSAVPSGVGGLEDSLRTDAFLFYVRILKKLVLIPAEKSCSNRTIRIARENEEKQSKVSFLLPCPFIWAATRIATQI